MGPRKTRRKGITKLDDGRDKKQVWRLPVRNKSFGENVLHWRKYLWYCWEFLAHPAVIRRPSNCVPFTPPRYAAADTWQHNRKHSVVMFNFHACCSLETDLVAVLFLLSWNYPLIPWHTITQSHANCSRVPTVLIRVDKYSISAMTMAMRVLTNGQSFMLKAKRGIYVVLAYP